jgi:NAD+ diphosphatase
MPDRRAASSGSGWIVLGSGGALLTEKECVALEPLCRADYDFSLEDGSSLRLLDLSGPDSPVPGPSGTQAAAEDRPELPPGFSLISLRSYYAEADQAQARAAAAAVHLAAFRRRVVHCPSCAKPLRQADSGTSLICDSCGLEEFPRVSPAVIVLTEWKGRILLARNARFTGGMHSLVAGFVEPGESFEETAARELMEETGVSAQDFRYAGSQPWPFPDSIMVGFRAKATGPEIKVDGKEILEAAWFGPDALPPIPRHGSIARRLIDEWLSERGFKAV